MNYWWNGGNAKNSDFKICVIGRILEVKRNLKNNVALVLPNIRTALRI